MKKLLIIGDSGLIGQAVIQAVSNDYKLFGLSRSEEVVGPLHHISYDLTNQPLMPILKEIEPDLVISCTRGPFLDQLRIHQELAAFSEHGDTKIYFMSTVNVFDGHMKAVHFESDPVNAVSDYGQFKIDCEKLLMAKLQDRAIIIRLPLVFGRHSGRVNQIREEIESKTPIIVYDNLLINTILDVTVAQCIKDIMQDNLTGIFHLGASDLVSHREFYKMLLPMDQPLQIESVDDSHAGFMALGTKRIELLDYFKSNQKIASIISSYLAEPDLS